MRPLEWHEQNVSRQLDSADVSEKHALLALERAYVSRYEARQYRNRIEKARKAGKTEMKVL